MTIAGWDPSGSSGVQADLPTFAALGVHGTSVLTVVTAQDTTGIHAFHPLAAQTIEAQLDPLLDDLAPAATKTGMLRAPEIIELVHERAAARRLGALVVDPVMVDSAGRPFVVDAAIEAYRRLAGHATVIAPNRWEAELLSGESYDDAPGGRLVGALRALGCPLVVVTGGRGDGPDVADLLITTDDVTTIRRPRVDTPAVRGTGCTFSAATAARLAQGIDLGNAVVGAADFVAGQLALTDALTMGRGRPGLPHIVRQPTAPTEE